MRKQILDIRDWEDFVAGKLIETEQDEARVDAFVTMRILRVYYEEAKAAIRDLNRGGGTLKPRQREMVLKRWRQIKILVQKAFRSSINMSVQASMHEQFELPPPLISD